MIQPDFCKTLDVRYSLPDIASLTLGDCLDIIFTDLKGRYLCRPRAPKGVFGAPGEFT